MSSSEPGAADEERPKTGDPANEEERGPEFLAITGPTASGKTRLSIEVARRIDGEIVSMDSRQVYRGMDVGTAKATLVERAEAPHHGLDILDPDESYSAGDFARDARRWIREIRGRGRIPIFVGGTGFFLSALMDPLFREPPMDEERVERLREHLEGYDVERLGEWVRVLDPERAEVAMEGGRQRLTRSLEVALLTGRPLSRWHDVAPEREGVDGMVTCIEIPRELLDQRIRERAERMMAEGLLEETRRLLDAGYGADDPGLTGVGYREAIAHLDREIGVDEAIDRIEVRTRQYSRRQLTWFRNQVPVDTVRIDGEATLAEQADTVELAWREAMGGSG